MAKDSRLFSKMMHRGIIPTRVRRRQSDAKWRASVAMCYNIMKTVIPNQKKLGRRKVSKALTLKETERHIVNLEKKLRELIEVRAPLMGKVVMVKKEDNCLYPASFEDVKHEFATKQLSFFASNSGSGKKRYNIPADIEASLENVSQQSSRLVVLNLSDVQSAFPTLPKLFQTSKKKTQRVPRSSTKSLEDDTLESDGQTVSLEKEPKSIKHHKTPSKCRRWMSVDGPENDGVDHGTVRVVTTPARPKVDTPLLHHTPMKAETSIQSGFTPVKLPMDLDYCDPVLSFPVTPAHSLTGSCTDCVSIPETPASCFNGMVDDFNLTEDGQSTNLLCTETIDTLEDTLDLEDCFGQSGTASSGSHERKEETENKQRSRCKRNLDLCYIKLEKDQSVPDGEGITSSYDDFGGNLFFYNHYGGKPLKDLNLTQHDGTMWQGFDADDNEVYSKLAAINSCNDNASLSPDLMGIELKPLNKEGMANSDYDEQYDLYCDNADQPDLSQEVPDLGLDPDLQTVKIPSRHKLLPEYEDLGIIFTEDLGKDSKQWFKYHHVEDEGEESQIVPELTMY